MITGSLLTAESGTILSDDKFISAARQGDKEAFGILFEQNKNAVYAFVLKTVGSREDAEDIVQETFCRAWRGIASFRGDCKILTWLCKIAANLCKDHMRSPRHRILVASDIDLDTENSAALSVAAPDIESEITFRQILNDALSELPLAHKILITLCDIQGFSCTEAAKVAGCSAISVRVRLSRARKKLQKLLSHRLEEVDL